MKQYCRYCAFCSEVDGGYYCGEEEHLMTESDIKRVNVCKLYAYTDCGDVITGKQYQPREKQDKQLPQGEQIEFE